MDEKDWLILQTLQKYKNITKTAEKLYISQPALSYRLQQIEKDLSVKIFSRSGRGIKFTSEGEYLAEYSSKMLLHLRKLKDTLSNMSADVQGELRIGVSSNYAHYRLPAILKEFLEQYPKVQPKVNTGWSIEILQMLKNDDIHVGIIRGDYPWDGPKLYINADPTCIISKQAIDLSRLPYLPRIDYKTDPHLKQLIGKWWQNNFTLPPLITMKVDKIETCKEMVSHGLGYGIIPRYFIAGDEGLFVQNLTDANNKVILRSQGMFYHSEENNLSVVKAFVDFMRNKVVISNPEFP